MTKKSRSAQSTQGWLQVAILIAITLHEPDDVILDAGFI